MANLMAEHWGLLRADLTVAPRDGVMAVHLAGLMAMSKAWKMVRYLAHTRATLLELMMGELTNLVTHLVLS